MSPAIDISSFAWYRVIKLVPKKYSPIGNSNKLTFLDLYFLFSIIIIKF